MKSFRPLRRAGQIALGLAGVAALALALPGMAEAKIFGGKPKPTTPTVGNRIPILSRVESGAKVDPDIAAVAVVLPPPEVNVAWGQGGGAANKAYGHVALGEAPQQVWNASIAGMTPSRRLGAAPVIGDGRLFAMDTNGVLHAYDAASGKVLWAHKFQPRGDSAPVVFGGGASLDGGKVYITTGAGEVAALDADSGKLRWSVQPAGPLRGAPTLAFGAVYVMTQNNEIHALNADDGVELWQESGSLGATGVFGVAAPAAGQGTVVAGYSTGELVAYRYENGRQLWSDALARTSLSTSVGVLTDIDADPIIERGRVYALGQGGRMAAYELVTGQRIWELNLAGISTPAIAGEWIFTLTDDAKLLCIARTTGKVRWITQLERWKNEKKKNGAIYWTGPVLAGNRLWLANSRGEIFAVSPTDGVPGRYAHLKAGVTLAPVVANSTLYVLDDSGRITAFK